MHINQSSDHQDIVTVEGAPLLGFILLRAHGQSVVDCCYKVLVGDLSHEVEYAPMQLCNIRTSSDVV
jgi:hypothetical protein